jgi:hypothetical protein
MFPKLRKTILNYMGSFQKSCWKIIVISKVLLTMKKYIKYTTDLINNKKNKKLEKETFERSLTYTYLKNADQSKYGSILAGLITQQSFGNNQYPKTITKAN